jgi:hypothetical protein
MGGELQAQPWKQVIQKTLHADYEKCSIE